MIAWTVPNGYVVCNKQWFMYKLWTFLFVYLDFPDLPESLSGSNPLSRRRILPTPPSAVNSQWILASNNSRLIRVGHGSGPSTGRVRLGRVGSGQEIWTHVQLWQKYLRNDLAQLTGERDNFDIQYCQILRATISSLCLGAKFYLNFILILWLIFWFYYNISQIFISVFQTEMQKRYLHIINKLCGYLSYTSRL